MRRAMNVLKHMWQLAGLVPCRCNARVLRLQGLAGDCKNAAQTCALGYMGAGTI